MRLTSSSPNYRPVVAAAVAAGCLMFAFGLTHRLVAARLAAPVTTTTIDPGVMERLPMQIGSWAGQDVPLDEDRVRRTGTDSHISRLYSRRNGSESISLYVGCGTRVDEVAEHRPEDCYRTAGWTLVDRRSMELPLSDGTKLPCIIFECFRGGLDTERMTVLHYFVIDGQHCSDVSLLRSKAWRIFAMAKYVAQVQIVASTESLTEDSAKGLVHAFAVDSAASIARLFEDIGKERSPDELGERLKGK